MDKQIKYYYGHGDSKVGFTLNLNCESSVSSGQPSSHSYEILIVEQGKSLTLEEFVALIEAKENHGPIDGMVAFVSKRPPKFMPVGYSNSNVHSDRFKGQGQRLVEHIVHREMVPNVHGKILFSARFDDGTDMMIHYCF